MAKKVETCECTIIHEDVINEVKNKMVHETEVNKVARLFKILGDNTRFKIINALLEAEMCVCDISNLLNMSQSLISHQLRVLREARLVKYRREGKIIYYSLNDAHIELIVKYGLEHINESGVENE